MAAARPLALVTGASSGIGRAYAERLAADGHDLILVARRRDRLEEAAALLDRLGGAAEILAADLSEPAGIAAVEQRIAGEDRLDFLLNNAGFGNYGPFVETDMARADRQIDLHLKATMHLCRAALPGMVARGRGSIVNVASTLAFTAPVRMERPKRATYAASKAFINAFTQIVANEIEGSGVRVQSLCPGVVRTEFHDNLGGRPPQFPALDPGVVVDASLAGLALGEVLCVPQLADAGSLARVSEALTSVWNESRTDHVAPRYWSRPSG
ncbi:MAG: SDR family oxidoreductase [Rhizobiales bacterium]|nr:SDR family oxidoreductase [Hyphomicrobiales bacterium]